MWDLILKGLAIFIFVQIRTSIDCKYQKTIPSLSHALDTTSLATVAATFCAQTFLERTLSGKFSHERLELSRPKVYDTLLQTKLSTYRSESGFYGILFKKPTGFQILISSKNRAFYTLDTRKYIDNFQLDYSVAICK